MRWYNFYFSNSTSNSTFLHLASYPGIKIVYKNELMSLSLVSLSIFAVLHIVLHPQHFSFSYGYSHIIVCCSECPNRVLVWLSCQFFQLSIFFFILNISFFLIGIYRSLSAEPNVQMWYAYITSIKSYSKTKFFLLKSLN